MTLESWFGGLLRDSTSREEAAERAWASLERAGVVSKVTVASYLCRARGCKIATLVRVGGRLLCAVRPYVYSPGLNRAQSVPLARERNTIDGDRRWPSHVHDVEDLHRFGIPGSPAGISMNCRHFRGVVLTHDILEAARTVNPGKPGPPIRLS